jgi:hypothetical protein
MMTYVYTGFNNPRDYSSFDKLIFAQRVKKFPIIMQTEEPLPILVLPASKPDLKPV